VAGGDRRSTPDLWRHTRTAGAGHDGGFGGRTGGLRTDLGHRRPIVRDAVAGRVLRGSASEWCARPVRRDALARWSLRENDSREAQVRWSSAGSHVSRADREWIRSARVLECSCRRALATDVEYGTRGRTARRLVG